MCSLRAIHCYEAFSNYTANMSRTNFIEEAIPAEECNHTLFVFFPYVENYSIYSADDALLVAPHTICMDPPGDLNETILISHDYGDHPFHVYSYIVDTVVCGENGWPNTSYMYLPVICAYENEPRTYVEVTVAIALAPAVVSLVITSLSVLSSTFMLLTYTLFKKLRTLPGQTVMNLAAAFFASDVMVIVLTSVVLSGIAPSPWIFIVETGFFHARFMWMTIVGFEISRHIYNGINLHFDSANRKIKILIIYLTIGWGTPLILGVISAAVEFTGAEADQEVKLFGANGRIITFLPLGLILVFNAGIALILLVALRRAASRRNKFSSRVKKGAVNFSRVYLVIMTALGLTWFSVFLALAISHSGSILQYFFLVLNSTQPIFVCVAFLGTRKIAVYYKMLLCSCFTEEDLGSSSSSFFPPIHQRARRILSVMMSDQDLVKSGRNVPSKSQNETISRPESSLTYVSRLSLSQELSLSLDGSPNTTLRDTDSLYSESRAVSGITCSVAVSKKASSNDSVCDVGMFTTIQEENEPSEDFSESEASIPPIP